ncbi:hypothetical protein EMIHUDRAFT_454466 [Emiliania huxleyi CCMP1516]|uniref:EamA domain-containing protein n=2 Tax=Emiliania huxleyi TaxID=2903 RepID=A0A0D3KTW5_EMIH1|nr:hypothetical protein EMIHUDRAFT_454466 [Emiliania huxleyi CCMP1516]EOD39200.1 hypothetical protein EMIHUDRAFT_454466 [Emiliania huxleyi CCMP1516]|eukprot:XP_005791629.1 hypothetical protein EMIHUDRAFT_454466 [Emiliania huxleyi CCMP1516]
MYRVGLCLALLPATASLSVAVSQQGCASRPRLRSHAITASLADEPGALPRARLALLGTSALWSTYPTFAKLIFAADGVALTPTAITAVRFAIMAIAGQFILAQQPASSSLGAADSSSGGGANGGANGSGGGEGVGFWIAATELGMWGCAGTQLNSMALLQLSAVRGTLLLASVNILTPLLQACIGSSDEQRRVAPRTWAACALALASTAFAVQSGGAAGGAAAFSSADASKLTAALCYALQKVRLSTFAQTYPAARLAAGRLRTQAAIVLLGLGGAALVGGLPEAAVSADLFGSLAGYGAASLSSALLLTLSALVPGAFATILQAEGQKVVPAASAQPIFASMPLFAAGWACLLLHEPISAQQAIGGAGTSPLRGCGGDSSGAAPS